MKFWEKIWTKLKTPSVGIYALSCVVTLILSTGALLILLVEYEGTALAIVAYALFGVAAISLSYTTYATVLYAPRFKCAITDKLHGYALTDKLIKNYGFRTLTFAVGSMFMTVLYGFYNGVIAVLFRSVWYGALAAYYIILVVIRGGILLYHGKTRGKEKKLETQLRKYRRCGVYLIVTILALSAAILQMVVAGAGFEKPGLTIYVAATYTFLKITMAIIHIFKARKQTDFTIQAIRNVNLADALVSILALQTSLLIAFSDGGTGVAVGNALTGGFVCALILALGIYMIVRSTKILKEREKRYAREQEYSV